jgi:hypothetical protein
LKINEESIVNSIKKILVKPPYSLECFITYTVDRVKKTENGAAYEQLPDVALFNAAIENIDKNMIIMMCHRSSTIID